MIKEEQQKYIKLLMAGDIDAAKKLASFKRSLLDVWSSDGGYFKLLPHYLTMKLIQDNKDYWKDSVRAAIEIAHEQGFGTVNGKSRENGMSLLHAYILGYDFSANKRKPDKIIDDLRELYKMGWRPQKINEATVKHNESQSGWNQNLMNELGFAFMSNMPSKAIEALIKVSSINEPCHASGMTMMQYAAKELMADMLARIASYGGDYKKRGEHGLCVPSARDILHADETWFNRIHVIRATDTNLLKINDKKMWEAKIYTLESRLDLEQGIFEQKQKKISKEETIKANIERIDQEKATKKQSKNVETPNVATVVPSATSPEAPTVASQEPPPRKAFRRRVLNHD